MLLHLKIQNFTLIEEADVSFNNGFTVITGETGSGKSILLGALGLIAGNRADVGTLKDASKKCVIEAEFDITHYALKSFFDEKELDYDIKTKVRREITPEGKSRVFVNDTPTTLSVIKELGEYLIDIHSQHESILLKNSNFQLELVDAMASTVELYSEYKKEFAKYQKINAKLNELILLESQGKKEQDYLQFIFDELTSTPLEALNYEALLTESTLLENSENIKNSLILVLKTLSINEQNTLNELNFTKQQINLLSKFGTQYESVSNRINSMYLELKDVILEIEKLEDNTIFEKDKLETIYSKLNSLNHLLKKHQVKSVEELIEIKNETEEKLNSFASIENDIKKTEKEKNDLNLKCLLLAKTLSDKRKESCIGIEQQIIQILSALALPNAQFKIQVNNLEQLSNLGLDTITFLFTANKGSDLKELHKTASGGEIARIMLSLKSIIANKMALPTIIFDEIDAGLSGNVANKVSQILIEMSQTMQLLTITHLPQIAAKGHQHILVYKQDIHSITQTRFKLLSNADRITEIANMLSADNVTEAAIQNAKELLNSN